MATASHDKSHIHRLRILYGSQTGNAQDLSFVIHRQAAARLLNPCVQPLSQYDLMDLPRDNFVLFVVSTTGDGETPDNMKRFWRFLIRKSLPSNLLSHLKFAVFGLGDSSYPKFNAVARKLQVRLLQLGATELIPRGLGDDQHSKGVYSAFDSWISKLWEHLLLLFPLPKNFVVDDSVKLQTAIYSVGIADPGMSKTDDIMKFGELFLSPSKSDYEPMRCRHVKLLRNQRITSEDWSQDVRHVEFQLMEGLADHSPGDIAVIFPENSEEEIVRLCTLFGWDLHDLLSIESCSHTPSMFPPSVSRKHLLRNYLDIMGTPRRHAFEHLSQFAANNDEKLKLLELGSSVGGDLYIDYCWREKRSWIDIFEDFPSCRPSIGRLLEIVPLLQPRQYSIASSARMHLHSIQLCIAVVDFVTPYRRRRKGVFSRWISSLRPGLQNTFRLWIKRGTFSFPLSNERNIVMIGPGTGLAPFRSLIQDYHSHHDRSDNIDQLTSMLYFGCRKKDKDFLYREELEQYWTEGTLTDLKVAFSRDQDHKIYVQTLLWENRKKIWKLLHCNGAVYIAGSAKRMPSDVRDVLKNIIAVEGQLNTADAERFLKALERGHRLQVEAWG